MRPRFPINQSVRQKKKLVFNVGRQWSTEVLRWLWSNFKTWSFKWFLLRLIPAKTMELLQPDRVDVLVANHNPSPSQWETHCRSWEDRRRQQPRWWAVLRNVENLNVGTMTFTGLWVNKPTSHHDSPCLEITTCRSIAVLCPPVLMKSILSASHFLSCGIQEERHQWKGALVLGTTGGHTG